MPLVHRETRVRVLCVLASPAARPKASSSGRRSDFLTAGKLAPGNLGLLQQYRHARDPSAQPPEGPLTEVLLKHMCVVLHRRPRPKRDMHCAANCRIRKEAVQRRNPRIFARS
jgi:hypothetical protein